MMRVPRGWSASAHNTNTITRPLDVVESWLHRMVAGAGAQLNRDPFAVTFRLKLKFPGSISDPAPYLRRTWLVARHHHPQLGAIYPSISAKEKNVTIGPLDHAEWLRTSFTEHEGAAAVYKTADDAVKQFQPTPTATAHWLPASSEFLIRTSHLRLDGLGLFRLTHSFMNSLASVTRLGLNADIESYPSDIQTPTPSPGMGNATKIEPDTGATPAYIQRAIDGFIDQYEQGKPGVAFPVLKGSERSPPGNTRRLAYTFGPSTTSAVRAACKARGISIAAAVQTALVRIAASYSEPSPSGNLLLRIATDLRKLLPPHYSDPEHAVGLYVASFPSCIPDGLDPGLPFVELAKKIHSAYGTDLSSVATDDEGNPVSFLKMLEPYLNSEMKLLGGLPHDSPIKRSPGLSSVGVLDKFIQREYIYGEGENDKVEVEDLWMAVDNVGQLPAFHLYTFRDKMRIQVCFNESYYTDKDLEAILERLRDVLVRELEL